MREIKEMLWIGGLLLLFASAMFGEKVVETVEENLGSWNLYDALFKKYGGINSVDWMWLKAIALNESNLGKEKSVLRGIQMPSDIDGSKSYDGFSWGLMQVTLRTAQGIDSSATAQKLNDPEYSVKLAAKYVATLKSYFNPFDDLFLEKVIKSYNQGPGNTQKNKPYADEYWSRFQRNLTRVKENP